LAQVKAHEVDRYLSRIDSDHRVFLIYGPDRGLVSERAQKIAAASGADLKDPFSTIKIDAEDAASDPQRISDEAHTVSMFGGDRVVWIRGSTQKNLANALQPVLDLPPSDALVIVEAGDLKKSSPLRTRIEKSSSSIALPCYQDQHRAIQTIIDEEVKLAHLSIEPDAHRLLISLLGDDRMASRAEVQKLCLYASGADTIISAHVTDIVGDASALALDTVVDSACLGDIGRMEHTLKRLIARGTAVFQVINTTQRHFQMLHLARATMEARGQPASSVINGLRPPAPFQRKDAITRALNIWKTPALARMLERLDKVSLESRKNSGLAVSLTTTTLLAIALEAKRQQRS